jgi:hypothetical protein
MMKLALMRTATGKKYPELPLLQSIQSLELPASEIAPQKYASESSSNRHISTSTVQITTKGPIIRRNLLGPTKKTNNEH